jgi:DNA end-binding protein Ku
MARAIWNGVITFGMVSIPVGLYTAVQDKDLRFNQIHEVCGSRIKQQKFCPVCDRVVESGELVKGYEYSKGSYVHLHDEDFEQLPVASKHAIEVTAFVKAEEIDPLYFDSSYYLKPEETARKPYKLLLQALRDKGVAAVGKIAMRSRENLCLLRATDEGVVLETLFYPDEIRKPETVALEDVQVEERELKMAETLVDYMSEEFDPQKYKDAYREALLGRIEDKVAGRQLVEAPVPEQVQVVDLMEALRQSLEQAKQQRKAG